MFMSAESPLALPRGGDGSGRKRCRVLEEEEEEVEVERSLTGRLFDEATGNTQTSLSISQAQ